jgi:hypothetical protein
MRYRALIRLARGDVAGALADIENATERSRLIRDPQDILPALSWRSLCLALTGDAAGATAALAELAEVEVGDEDLETMGPSSVVPAFALLELGRRHDIPRQVALGRTTNPWHDTVRAMGAGELVGAADILGGIAGRSFEAHLRLRAAAELRSRGRVGDADTQLRRALAFYRGVRATAAIREGEALLAVAS